MRRICTVLLALAMLFPVACGKKKPPVEEPPPVTMSANPGSSSGFNMTPTIVANTPVLDRTLATKQLKDIHILYDGGGVVPPPASLEEFTELKRGDSKLYNAVKDGHYVVIWKASRNVPTAVLAYWKDTPEKGGPALLVNGEVVFMTPEEFKAAPKAAN